MIRIVVVGLDHMARMDHVLYRAVQIILRQYRSISEILCGFDLDSACVAYNGRVWALPRARRAILYR